MAHFSDSDLMTDECARAFGSGCAGRAEHGGKCVDGRLQGSDQQVYNQACELDPEYYMPGSKLLCRDVRPGLKVSICDFICRRDDQIVVETEPSLYFGLMTEGACSTLNFNHGNKFQLRPLAPVLMAFGEKTSCAGKQRVCARCASIGVTMSLDFVELLAQEYSAEIFWEILEKIRNDVFMKNLPQTSQLSAVVQRMLENPYDGPLAGLHLESCTLALIVEIARSLLNEKVAETFTDLSRREIQRAHMVRELLEENIVDPPSLAQLSREVGINPTTMSAHFRKVFGNSIFSYLRNRRLELARVLVRTQEIPIAQIGYRVGFSNPAAFATAYKKHFGHPPSSEGRLSH